MLSRTPRTVAIRAAATAPLLGRRAFSSEAVRFDFNPDRPIECYETDGPQPNDHYMATGEEMKEYLGHMITARRMEIVNDNLYKAQKIKGFCHLYDGQEAIGMGMEAAMTKSDSLTTSYRCHAWQYFRGNGEGVSSVKSVIAELMGKAEGCSKGKGGSMHMYNPAMGFFGGNGIVGAQASTATGNALAFKYSGEKGSYNVSFGLYGDGAANQGQIFESMNMAALWKLPMVYVCENNKFGMGTSTKRSSALDEYYKRGQYMPGLKVDGMDVLSVKACTEFAIAHCRAGNGPFVLEMDTYRYHGHSMSDPGTTYRTRDDIKSVRDARDPIDMTKARLVDMGFMTAEEIKAYEKSIRKVVDTAAKEAGAGTLPPSHELMDNIYLHDATARAIELKDSRIVPKENEENNNWGHDLSYRNATGEAAQKKWIQ